MIHKLHSVEEMSVAGKTYRLEFFERLPDETAKFQAPKERRWFAYLTDASGWAYQTMVCGSLSAARAAASRHAQSHASGEIFTEAADKATSEQDAAAAILGLLRAHGEMATMDIHRATKIRRSTLTSALGRMSRRRELHCRRQGHKILWRAA